MRLTVVVTLLFALPAFAQVEVPLWPDQLPPFAKDVPNEEYVDDCWGNVRCAHDVTVPTLTFYPASTPSQNWILIAPGGGYGVVAIFHEGSEIAQAFVDRGISAAIVKYRIPDARTATAPEKVALTDLRRAMKMLRAEQEKAGIRNGKIGLVGFSATGHLSVYSMVHPDPEAGLNADFAIIAYGVSQLNTANQAWLESELYYRPLTADEQSREDLLSRVNGQTPPAFLIHAKDDSVVPVEESVMYAEALQAHGIEAELHVIEDGGHGFGPGRDKGESAGWLQLAADWVEER